MNDKDYAEWAAHLRDKYGIAEPMAPETEDDTDE